MLTSMSPSKTERLYLRGLSTEFLEPLKIKMIRDVVYRIIISSVTKTLLTKLSEYCYSRGFFQVENS